MKNNKKRAFSTLELLVSLIVIACILMAFTPLITKKLSGGIFSNSKSNITTNCSNSDNFGPDCVLCTDTTCLSCAIKSCGVDEYKNVAKCECSKCSEKYGEFCTKCDKNKCLACASGFQMSSNPASNEACVAMGCNGPNYMQIGDLCITRKNMGDSDVLTIPDTVKIVNTGTTCDADNEKCCWQGETADPANCDNENGGGYSGCNRTVCDWSAANEICSKFNGLGKTWRLAARDEMDNWRNNSNGLGVDGLQLCDYISGFSAARCSAVGNCSGAFSNCYPYTLWSVDEYISGYAFNYSLYNGGWVDNWYKKTSAFSVRCVADMTDCREKYGEHCSECDKDQCLACDNGYKLNSDPTSNNACIVDCEAKYGQGCASCNDTQCLSCGGCGYALSSDPSANPACADTLGGFCQGDAIMRVCSDDKILCVTKYNMGDHADLPISSDVSITSTGVECDYVNLCCWQGNTADSCDSTNGDYSGCNRTVCDWRAAAYTCKDFNLLGYKWRLASEGEMQNWLDNSRNLGNSGLQLCDNSSNIQSSQCGGSTNCLGPSSSECNPNNIWTNDLYLETISSNQRYFIPGQSTTEYNVYAIASEITNDSLSSFSVKMNISTEYDIITENITDASSVRCVADYCQFKFGNACKRCSATECLECEEFYELDNPKSSNACTRTEPYARIGDYVITAFNMGDHPDLPLSPSVALHNSPAEADFTYNECWIDTSTDCGNSNSDYSACGRTICDALAAKEICDSAGFTLPDEGLMKLMTAYGYTSYLEENAQLCSENSGTNYAYCESQQGCMNECAPSNVWGIDATGRAPNMTAKINLALYFNPPYMNLEYHVPNRGHSVRCVVP